MTESFPNKIDGAALNTYSAYDKHLILKGRGRTGGGTTAGRMRAMGILIGHLLGRGGREEGRRPMARAVATVATRLDVLHREAFRRCRD